MTIPRLAPDPIATAPLPGVRVPTDVPARAFGSPEQPDLAPFQQQVTELVQRERDKADTTALLDADNKLATLQTDLHTQATTLRGKDALGAAKIVGDGWQKGVSDIMGGLTTDQQRRAFANRVGARWGSLYEAVETHAANETQQYAEQTAGDALKNRLSHAVEFYQQPGVIQQSVDETKAILQDFGKRQGWSPETLTEKTTSAVTNIHANVIDRMLANRQDLAAADYLTAHRDEMDGPQLAQAEKAIGHGVTLGEAFRQTDAIVKSSKTLSEALDKAGQILDPTVREKTEDQVRRHFEDEALSKRIVQDQAYDRVGQVIRTTGSIDHANPSDLALLAPPQYRELKLLEVSLTKRPSDPDTLIKLRNMAGLNPTDFAKIDLGQYRETLSDSDWRSLMRTQQSMRMANVHQAGVDARRQNKDLGKLRTEAGFYTGRNLAVPADLTTKIAALSDSVKTRQSTTPSPGAPLPSRTPTPAPQAGTSTVPQAWLDRADRDPKYKAYLQQHHLIP